MIADPTHAATLNKLVRLASAATMSTTYKPALLKALVRAVQRNPAQEIALETIGAEFVRLYWVQTVVFHLRQAATIQREPEVVKAIRRSASDFRIRDLRDLPALAHHALTKKMAHILTINVLAAFHRSAPQGMQPLFNWTAGARSITLSDSALRFLQEYAAAVESLANLWWARKLERVNLLAPRVIEKVERDGAERRNLTYYVKLLQDLDGPLCFYCSRPLSPSIGVHVDHVIPWSFLLADPAWDLVLSCVPCNLAKSDFLPQREFLEKLALVSGRRAKLSFPTRLGSPFIAADELQRIYDAALGVEWPSGWCP